MATELVCCYADGHSPFVRELLNLMMVWGSSPSPGALLGNWGMLPGLGLAPDKPSSV